MSGDYDAAFFARQIAGSRRAAAVIVDLVNDVLTPRSVLDIGCGLGAWVARWHALGVAEAWGCDGAHVDLATLDCAPDRFIAADLADLPALGQRFAGAHYDLVSALEVAEHLPQAQAGAFVRFLCDRSDHVLFGAAVPGQGGTGHLNEQYASWWVRHFAARGYTPVDIIRPLVFAATIPFWYRQNTLLFVRDGAPLEAVLARIEANGLARRALTAPMDAIHPALFDHVRTRAG